MVKMPRDARLGGGAFLLSYAIASGGMWYSEIGQREIYLRREPQQGLILQGEIPESSPACYANLSEILLEYCCGCEQCVGDSRGGADACRFADRLGSQLMAKLQELVPEAPDSARASAVMDILLNSMGVTFEKELTVDGWRYDLVALPINKAARGSGLDPWESLAMRAFLALSTFVVRAAAPGWVFVPPSASDANFLWITPISPEN